MTSYLETRDRIVPAIHLGETTIQVTRAKYADTINVTIPAGKYYAYLYRDLADAPQSFRDAFPSIYDVFRVAFNTAWDEAGETIAITASNPSSSTLLGNTGITITGTDTGQFDLVFPTLTIARLFGSNSLTTPTVSTVFVSPFSVYGKWLSPRRHASRLGNRINIQSRNSGNRAISQTTKWHQRAIRTLKYDWIFANHVSIGRNVSAAYASAGYMPVATNEHGNYFGDCWDLMSRGDDALIVYDDGNDDLFVTSHSWEILRLEDMDSQELNNVISLANEQGNAEIYNIRFNSWRDLEPSGWTTETDIANYYRQD